MIQIPSWPPAWPPDPERAFDYVVRKDNLTPAEALKVACEVWGFFPSLVRRHYERVVQKK